MYSINPSTAGINARKASHRDQSLPLLRLYCTLAPYQNSSMLIAVLGIQCTYCRWHSVVCHHQTWGTGYQTSKTTAVHCGYYQEMVALEQLSLSCHKGLYRYWYSILQKWCFMYLFILIMTIQTFLPQNILKQSYPLPLIMQIFPFFEYI